MPIIDKPAFAVETHLVRRGADGSLACYEIKQVGQFTRCHESESETIDEVTARAITASIVQQLAQEIAPQIYAAVRNAQGEPMVEPGAVIQ